MTSSESITKARSIFEHLRLKEVMNSALFMERLQYSNCYLYYKLPYHRVRPLKKKEYGLLAAFNNFDNGSVYISIPFCENMCLFCHRHKQFAKDTQSAFLRYAQALKKEIELLNGYVHLKSLKLHSVYCGGGTPACLGIEHMSELLCQVSKHFSIEETTRFSIEADPAAITNEEGFLKLALLKNMGFERISLGLQEFDDEVLSRLGRKNRCRHNNEALQNARKAGFSEINADLMYGLPHQDLTKWSRCLEKVTELAPDSIDIYKLRFDGFSRMYSLFIKYREVFPSEEELLLMKIMCKGYLQEKGYEERYPGFFTKISTQETHPYFMKERQVLGLGANARGQRSPVIYFNEDGKRYLDQINRNTLPILNIFKLNDRQLAENSIISCLAFFEEGISVDELRRQCAMGASRTIAQQFDKLLSLGLIEEKAGFYNISYKGSFFAENVFKSICSQGPKERVICFLAFPQLKRPLYRWFVTLINYLKRKRQQNSNKRVISL